MCFARRDGVVKDSLHLKRHGTCRGHNGNDLGVGCLYRADLVVQADWNLHVRAVGNYLVGIGSDNTRLGVDGEGDVVLFNGGFTVCEGVARRCRPISSARGILAGDNGAQLH